LNRGASHGTRCRRPAWPLREILDTLGSPTRHAALRRARLSIDVSPEVRRRVRIAASRADVSIRDYVVAALQKRLTDDLGDEEGDHLGLLSGRTDPVLAALWDNDTDAAYDDL
jgi:hypothetical protein